MNSSITSSTPHPIVTLTGIKPTGELHLGNLLGAIRPMARLAQDPTRELYVFVADLHALNTRPDPKQLRAQTRSMAAALVACGLEGSNVRLFRQSDVAEISQLNTLLANLCPKGALNRAHAYKATVDANRAHGREPDTGVNMGLFNYPVLMAADILALGADQVPVGQDQAQHLEIAVDLVQAFERAYRPGVLVAPQALIDPAVATLPGLDGRKMSKSYGNTIPLFAEPAQLRKLVARIKTDSRRPEEPKDPSVEGDTLLTLLREFASPETVAQTEAGYRAGGLGYGAVKQTLSQALEESLAPARERYAQLLAEPAQLEQRLEADAEAARARARKVVGKTMRAMGLR